MNNKSVVVDGAHNQRQRALQSVWPLLGGGQGKENKEFEAHLHAHTVFAINTSNATINTHPPSFCYLCKLVLDKCVLAQDQQHTPFKNSPF